MTKDTSLLMALEARKIKLAEKKEKAYEKFLELNQLVAEIEQTINTLRKVI